jgi:putative molybdopterin biosynthesis protein
MSDEFMNTREVARYLDIHEKQVYALIKAGRIPATRVTGKWIFPKTLIDEWLASNAAAAIQPAREKRTRARGVLLAAGSNDPILDLLLSSLKEPLSDFFIFSAVTGSTQGLRLLQQGLADLAWCHLFDRSSGEYNTPKALAAYLPSAKTVGVHLFRRELGLVAAPGNPKEIRCVEDLARDGVRLINRQEGSGTRLLLDYHLDKAGIAAEGIAGYDEAVSTHMEVGLSVLAGEADVGVATIAAARILGLAFIPLIQESFDMILGQSVFFEPGVQAFIERLQSAPFRGRAGHIADYDFGSAGKILFTTDRQQWT